MFSILFSAARFNLLEKSTSSDLYAATWETHVRVVFVRKRPSVILYKADTREKYFSGHSMRKGGGDNA